MFQVNQKLPMRAIVGDSLDHHCTTSSRSRGCTQDAFDQLRLNSYECRYSALLLTVGDGGCGCFTCTDAGYLFHYLCELHILLGEGGSVDEPINQKTMIHLPNSESIWFPVVYIFFGHFTIVQL